MIEKLKMYLNGAVSYDEACSIFLLIGPNKRLANTLIRYTETDFSREKLRYEIERFLESQPEALIQAVPDPEIQSDTPSVVQIIVPAIEPVNNPLLDQITNQWKSLYRERGHLHGRLHQEDNKAKSLEIAKQIIEMQPKIDRLKLDMEMLQAGKVPSAYLKKNVSAQQYIEIRNTKQYIARYEKKLKEQTDPKEIEKTQQLIEKYKTKLQNL